MKHPRYSPANVFDIAIYRDALKKMDTSGTGEADRGRDEGEEKSRCSTRMSLSPKARKKATPEAFY